VKEPCTANTSSRLDYDPFGMVTVGRSWSVGSEYRYGFNSQEQDDEVYGNGNLNSALYWEYDSRLGRRWNIDPVVKSFEAPFVCFSNNPIIYSDLKGDKIKIEGSRQFRKETKKNFKEIKRSVDSETRKSIKALEKDKNRLVTINEMGDNKDYPGFYFGNNDFQGNIGIADASTLESLVVPGQKKITYDDGTIVYEFISGNALYTLANELSHAIDWHQGKTDSKAPLFDDYTGKMNTGNTVGELRSNQLENQVRAKNGDPLRLEKSHYGKTTISPASAKKLIAAHNSIHLIERDKNYQEHYNLELAK